MMVYIQMYDPPVSGISGYRLHLIMAPQRVLSGFSLRTHLAEKGSGAMGPYLAKYAKPEKLPRLPRTGDEPYGHRRCPGVLRNAWLR